MRKKLLLFVLPVLVFVCAFSMNFRGAVAAEPEATLTLTAPEYASPGDTINVQFSITLAAGVSASTMDAYIKYDKNAFEYIGLSQNYAGGNINEVWHDSSRGVLTAVFVASETADDPAIQSGTTLLYTFEFKIKESAADGAAQITILNQGIDDTAVGGSVNGSTLRELTTGLENASINIIRVLSSDNTLHSLTVDNGTLSPAFDAETTDYTVNVDYDITSINIGYEVNDSTASAVFNGNSALLLGENTFTITVTAQNGDVKTYTVKVTRAQCADNTLKSITPSTGVLSPVFAPGTFEYIVNVPFTTQSITIDSEKNHETATLNVEGNNNLSIGDNIFKFNVTAQNGDIKTYTVNVKREAARTDNTLKSLTVNKGTLSPAFASGTTDYTVNVGYDVTSINIGYEVNDSTASAVFNGNTTLLLGENTFTITVTAQNGDVKTYTVKVIRAQCADNTLKSITPSTGVLSPVFSADTLEYTINVLFDVDSITINAEKNHETGALIIEGNNNLSIGNNAFTIKVTAQNGDIKTYTVNVIRGAAKTDNTLKSLTVNKGTLSPAFASGITDYTVNVGYDVTNINIGYEVNDLTASAVFNGNSALLLGENVFTITVTAQNDDVKTYTVKVIRAQCADNTLKSITPSTGALSPEFNAGILEYIVNVPYLTEQITINAEKNHETATLIIEGNNDLAVGDNIFTIKVTAQNGDVKDYTVNVKREAPKTDNTLRSLTVDNGLLSPEFAADILNYTVNVDFDISSIDIAYELNDLTASAEFFGNNELDYGENIFTIKVTAQNGDIKIYTVNVVRARCADNSLSSMTPSAGELLPEFDPDVLEYTMDVMYAIDSITINAEKNHETAEINIEGDGELLVGENIITVTVTAQNGDIRVYRITVNRGVASTDNSLGNIELSTGELLPEFDSDITEYTVEVPFVTDVISIIGLANDPTANVANIENVSLDVGENIFTLIVTAQNGDEKIYNITVTRAEPSTDSSLKSLSVSTGKLSPAFSPELTEYTVNVPYITTLMKLQFEANDPLSALSCESPVIRDLEVGENVFVITVMAENGDSTTYTVTVNRGAASADNKLQDIVLSDGELSPEFNPDIIEYTVSVPYLTEFISISGEVNDVTASVENIGEKSIKVGRNYLELKVTAQNGDVKIYKITVIRALPSNDSSLKSLTPSDGKLSPEFDPDVTVYNITVGYKTDYMFFEWESNNPNATVWISGEEELTAGAITVYTITVEAEDGSTTYYIVNVNRLLKSNNTRLSYLTVGGTSFVFDPAVKSYDIAVPFGVSKAIIEFETEDENASAVLSGNVNLSENKVNVFTITVTAENGAVAVYKLNITHRSIETDSTLKSLEVSEGSIQFDPDVTEYNIIVAYSTEMVTLSFQTNSKYAIALYEAPEKLEIGKLNIFKITVIAEDATRTVYTVKIYRVPASNDSTLKILESEGYELTPEFAPDIITYSVYVPYSKDTISFYYEANHEFATVEYNGVDELVVGEDNIFTIRVIAENGLYTEYTIKVYRDFLSEDSSLSSLSFVNGQLYPEFSPEEVNYTVTVPYSTNIPKFEYKTGHIASTVQVNGPSELIVGENVYRFTVIAENKSSTVYTVTVVRSQKESDSTLKTLTPSSGTIDFDPLITEYEIFLEFDVSEINFAFEPTSKFATASMTGNRNLEAGKTTMFVISVTAEDGSRTNYTINVFRRALSEDSSAAKIAVDGNELDLSSGKTDFVLSVPYSTVKVKIAAIANDSRATVEIKKESDELNVGDNTIKIVITAENGATTTYTICIVRDAGSSNAYLEKLTPQNGTFNETFDMTKFNYTMTVEQDVDRLILEVKTAHEKSTFDVSDTMLRIGENIITVTVISENGTTLQYKVKVIREKASFWTIVTEKTLFTIGSFNVTTLVFVVAAFAVIGGCATVLILLKKYGSKR